MEIKKLWTLPILSSDIRGGIKIRSNGMNVTLSFSCYPENNKTKTIEIKFERVLCYMKTCERFTKELFDSYDTLVSMEDSKWLENLKIQNSEEFDNLKPKHFIMYFDSEGQHQFIACGFSININEK